MSLAVAHQHMKRKKKCHGGQMAEGGETEMHESENPVSKGMKKAFHAPGYAEGGHVKMHHVRAETEADEQRKKEIKGVHKPMSQLRPGRSSAGLSSPGISKDKHEDVLHEMREMKGQDRKYLAEGGEVMDEMKSGYEDMPMPCENCGHVSHAVENQHASMEDEMDDDMISHIMSKRKSYSEGGKVSNDDEPVADSEEAEYDDLVKDDDLEEHYTAKNSGDEVGDEAEDEDEKDTVSQIMKSRKKKDKMPRPA